ncbi:MAG: helix-turn-helix transcriptional regulator [Phycisphaerae bacterium]|jgi:transcriptional regulator with XRE-family HTH domain|nr:helix-turn-helix transcriptional regulator [Phycisphaerae bacterium]
MNGEQKKGRWASLKDPGIGAICLKRRHEVGLRQDETAVRGGLTYSALSKIERGRSRPTIDTIVRIAFACGYSDVSVFLYGLKVKDVLGQAVYDHLISTLPPVRDGGD